MEPTRDEKSSEEAIVFEGLFPRAVRYQVLHPPAPDPQLMETCAGKTVMAGVMGYALGAVIGVVLGSYSNMAPPIPLPGQRQLPDVPVREQLYDSWRSTGKSAKSWAQNFMVITAIFSGAECVIEKARGAHDSWNPVIGGCAAGAALAAKQGPTAMCWGCAGFAAFSAAIEKVTGGH
eukprot:g3810.t1